MRASGVGFGNRCTDTADLRAMWGYWLDEREEQMRPLPQVQALSGIKAYVVEPRYPEHVAMGSIKRGTTYAALARVAEEPRVRGWDVGERGFQGLEMRERRLQPRGNARVRCRVRESHYERCQLRQAHLQQAGIEDLERGHEKDGERLKGC